MPAALRRTFTYSIPPELETVLEEGHRVRIPFGRQKTFGYVIGFTSEAPAAALKPIQAVDPIEPLLTPEILHLTEWVADYYLAPWGQVLEAALPPAVRRKSARTSTAIASVAAEDPAAGPASTASALPRTILEPEQTEAANAILAAIAAEQYAAFLLLGVTGSGKTEVYLEAAERVVQAGGGVLFLVPEIAMGTQILSRVRDRFGPSVGLFHSQMSEGYRRNVWRQAREGRLPVIVGARSAVFVPMPRLRLVVVDEEHESAYKQEETPRYHGRDTAVYRAGRAGAVVVLGSATPSLESLYNVEKGKYRLLRLNRRIDGRPPARVTIVDLREPPDAAGSAAGPSTAGGAASRRRPSRPAVLSAVLLRAVQERLDRGEQTILFLNRRGHSPVVQCSDCGTLVQCQHCDVAMTLHKSDGILRCHYCNAILRGVKTCAECGGSRFFYGGVGTQKLEELLHDAYPGARIARMDFDATRRRGQHAKLVGAMETGELDILVGTRMVAKGFHFPRVTLVGVIQADREMMQPDFRAAEKAFQILTQVAGRSGRGRIPGEVIFQSLMPWHHVIGCAAEENYAGFAEQEMEARRALLYPPYHRIADLLVDGAKEDLVRRRAEALRETIERHLGDEHAGRSRRRSVEVLGPAPMPRARLKGRYRWHLTLKSASVQAIHAAAATALEAAAPPGLSATRVQVDIDPLGIA